MRKTRDNIKRHKNRKDLAGEYSLGDAGQLILLILFLVVWICDSFLLNFSSFLSNYIPLLIRIIISAIIFFFSGYLAKSGLKIVFGEIREESYVIRKGIFNRVRHPIYLGSVLFYLGLLILTLSIISAVFWIIIIVFYNYISKYEERILLQEFGHDYEQYMKEVPMWIPRIFKKKNEK
jgi:protein-S-isoprenylcysteine O-methyltransferase Ste14